MNAKPIAIALILAVIVNLIFFVLGKISQLAFWIVVMVVAFIAYKIMPKLKKA